jgi:hypothetical protein
MTAAYFEDHPTDPDKMILRKPRLDQGPDYERGFIDGMMYQTQSSVYKAVDAMSKRKWVGLTDEEIEDFVSALWPVGAGAGKLLRAVEAKLKEKNT